MVDSVLRAEADEAVASRASALGWAHREGVVVVLGEVPSPRIEDLFDQVRRAARAGGMDALCATQGDRLVVILGGVADADKAGHAVVRYFGPGPVVVGLRSDDLATAHVSARSALSGLRAAVGWPDAPRPVSSDDLLPERVLAGDGHARRHLVDEVYVPLRGALRPGAPRSSTRSRRTSSTASRSRVPRERSSSIPTRCATGSVRSPRSPGSRPRTPGRRSPCSWRWCSDAQARLPDQQDL